MSEEQDSWKGRSDKPQTRGFRVQTRDMELLPHKHVPVQGCSLPAWTWDTEHVGMVPKG